MPVHNLDQLGRTIACRLAARFDPENTLVSLLAELGDEEGAVREIVRNALSCRSVVQEIAGRSYLHENGFFKVVLIASEVPAFKLRLHLWPAGDWRNAQQEIHNHRWHFASRIFRGEFIHRLFSESNTEGDQFLLYRYAPREDKEFFEMHAVGERRLVTVKEARVRAGDIYFLSADSVHSFFPCTAEPACSLVLQGAPCRLDTSVYVPVATTKEDLCRTAPAMQEEQLKYLLRQVAAL